MRLVLLLKSRPRPRDPTCATNPSLRSQLHNQIMEIGTWIRQFTWIAFLVALPGGMVGCGSTTQRLGTEQLLMSDAVDMSIAQIDFRPLQTRKVYLDSTYLQSIKGIGFVNAPYIISSLRQQLTAAGCLLQDNRDDADIIVEARVGALGTDGHEITYGMPKNNLLNSAASVLPNAPPIPTVPEISAARVEAQSGVAKVYVFAYDRESREPIWQSGVAKAESTSRSSWILGAGPFQRGTVHDGTRFTPLDPTAPDPEMGEIDHAYFEQRKFESPASAADPAIRVATRPEEPESDEDGEQDVEDQDGEDHR